MEGPKKRFQSPEERQAAISHLQQLIATTGWRDVMVLKLQDEVTILQHHLESGEFLALEQVQRIQDRLRVARHLLHAPEDLIKQLQSGTESPMIFDVFD